MALELLFDHDDEQAAFLGWRNAHKPRRSVGFGGGGRAYVLLVLVTNSRHRLARPTD